MATAPSAPRRVHASPSTGEPARARGAARRTLAEALREDLGLTGTKVGCNRAECGSCTVLVDGRAVFACTVLAVEAAGRVRSTPSRGSRGRTGRIPLQAAFIEYDAVQCGICIPGMLMSVQGAPRRDADADRGRDPRGGRRQPLPLRHLPEHGEGHAGGARRALRARRGRWRDERASEAASSSTAQVPPTLDRALRGHRPARSTGATRSRR